MNAAFGRASCPFRRRYSSLRWGPAESTGSLRSLVDAAYGASYGGSVPICCSL